LISKNKSIELIIWQEAGLENLLGSPCIKRRIRRRAIKDYQTGEHKKLSVFIEDCTYESTVPDNTKS
jgi:hypothetical protein